ncbi:MAG: hypothetical protein KAJ18_12345 [Candidatus Omnitrophica bacterium]|nr:hypothetical protein [Candidatus Omnitrophota bacterium]
MNERRESCVDCGNLLTERTEGDDVYLACVDCGKRSWLRDARQTSFFESEPTPAPKPDRTPGVRLDDPQTSHTAARLAGPNVETDWIQILDAISCHDRDRGLAYFEIEDVLGWTRNKAARRLSALVISDLLERRTKTVQSPGNRPCQLHRITVRGLQYLVDLKTPASAADPFVEDEYP